MSAHLTDDLPRLLTGEATRTETLAAAEHLRSCVDCQQELVSAVVAHASLTSAQRFAPEIVAGTRAGDAGDEAEAAPVTERSPQPDLSAVFAQVRREAAEAARSDREKSPYRSRRYALAAAAAVVVIGAGVGVYAATSGGGGPATRVVPLAAYDRGTTSATAHIGNGTVELTATSLPRLDNKRYEVWLTDKARTRMQPIGWVGGDGTARLTVPAGMMRRYQDIEVSVQDLGAHSYDYSGQSVLRGAIG